MRKYKDYFTQEVVTAFQYDGSEATVVGINRDIFTFDVEKANCNNDSYTDFPYGGASKGSYDLQSGDWIVHYDHKLWIMPRDYFELRFSKTLGVKQALEDSGSILILFICACFDIMLGLSGGIILNNWQAAFFAISHWSFVFSDFNRYFYYQATRIVVRGMTNDL